MRVAGKGGGASRWLDQCIWSSGVIWAGDLGELACRWNTGVVSVGTEK